MTRILPMLLIAVSLVAGGAFAQERVALRSSASSSVSGQIKGDDSAQYALAAGPDQQVTVKLVTNNPSNYFNVERKGSSEAVCQGALTGNVCMFRPETGADYVIHVFLMRNAARRGEQAQYTLSMEQSSSSTGQSAPAADMQAASAAMAACKSALALKSGANPLFVLPLSHVPAAGGYEVFLMLQGVQWLCATDSRGNVNRLEQR